MIKINLIGTEHMSDSLSICLRRFGNQISSAEECDVCWIAIDTPVNNEGHGKVGPILDAIKGVKPHLRDGVLVVVSSQIPVGTSKKIQKLLGNNHEYAYMPELMRIGKGVDDFMDLARVVIGVDNKNCKTVLEVIFEGKAVMFTSVATAEMIKHANNAFLATSLSFIYDIADICEAVGADVTDVAEALRDDRRIGKEAYLDASVGFSGGHLERDLDYLQKVAKSKHVNIPVIDAVVDKNNMRRDIVISRLGRVAGKKIAFWGITYKSGVPPSDNSLPAKLMRDLKGMGARFGICDPWYEDSSPWYENSSLYKSVEGSMAVICITPWPDLKDVDFRRVAKLMTEPKIFFDARNYFAGRQTAIEEAGLKYIGVGR